MVRDSVKNRDLVVLVHDSLPYGVSKRSSFPLICWGGSDVGPTIATEYAQLKEELHKYG